MGAAILQQGCVMQCLHGGVVNVTNTNLRVKVAGNFVLLATDLYTIAGCPFTTLGGSPQPCVTVEWQAPAQRVNVDGKPVLLQSSNGTGIAVNQIRQGSIQISGVQTRVMGI